MQYAEVAYLKVSQWIFIFSFYREYSTRLPLEFGWLSKAHDGACHLQGQGWDKPFKLNEK